MKMFLRHKHYPVKNVKVHNILKSNDRIPTCCHTTQWHSIVIWQNEIYDANAEKVLKLTKENLDWCVGENQKYISVIDAFQCFPNKKLCKTLNLEFVNIRYN